MPNKDTSSPTLSTVGLLLKRLIGQFTHPLYMPADSQSCPVVRPSLIEQPYIELFLWAVVSNRYFTLASLHLSGSTHSTVLALYLLKHVEEPLQSLLAGMSIARRLARKAGDQ
jgi:hypothetical protein